MLPLYYLFRPLEHTSVNPLICHVNGLTGVGLQALTHWITHVYTLSGNKYEIGCWRCPGVVNTNPINKFLGRMVDGHLI